jgi:FKBP-type peptidyl-prolyl cis-trans isomerase SlyD
MQVDKNRVVTLTYTLTLENGETIDSATAESPFVFIHGIGQTLPHFDSNLKDLLAGDAFEFSITAENAYGISSEEYIVKLPRTIFSGPEVPADILQVGNVVPMQDQEGHPMNGIILDFNDENVIMDFNHPLADKNLTFKGNIISVREATEDELNHGHVHGPGGHHH